VNTETIEIINISYSFSENIFKSSPFQQEKMKTNGLKIGWLIDSRSTRHSRTVVETDFQSSSG